jgi:hypothetical protein
MSSRKPSRELSIGEIFSETFSLYSKNFTNYVIPFLVAGAITGLLTMLVRLVIIVPAQLTPGMTPQQILNWLPGYLAAVITLAIATGLISWVVGSMAQGIIIKFASDSLEKGQANLQTSFSFAASRILSILAVSLITGVLIFLGALALVIPGIILAIMFSLVVQTIIIENTGALESLARSRRLVSGRWLKTFALLLVLYIIVGIVAGIAGAIGTPFGLAGSLVSNLIGALIQPILPIGLTLYYYSMIARTTPQTATQAQP